MAKVVVYTGEHCPWCHKVMDFLKENNIELEPRDLINQAYAKEVVEKSGQSGIPVTEIDGKLVVGFDVKKIKELLGLQ